MSITATIGNSDQKPADIGTRNFGSDTDVNQVSDNRGDSLYYATLGVDCDAETEVLRQLGFQDQYHHLMRSVRTLPDMLPAVPPTLDKTEDALKTLRIFVKYVDKLLDSHVKSATENLGKGDTY